MRDRKNANAEVGLDQIAPFSHLLERDQRPSHHKTPCVRRWKLVIPVGFGMVDNNDSNLISFASAYWQKNGPFSPPQIQLSVLTSTKVLPLISLPTHSSQSFFYNIPSSYTDEPLIILFQHDPIDCFQTIHHSHLSPSTPVPHQQPFLTT